MRIGNGHSHGRRSSDNALAFAGHTTNEFLYYRAMKLLGFCLLLFFVVPCAAQQRAEFILVEKKERRLTLFHEGAPLRSYRVALGQNPAGHKLQEGDERTPEGTYFIDYKNADSDFHRSLKISYPNRRDKTRAQQAGVSPGGLIMIHGLGDTPRSWHGLIDWTDGCIAVTDEEIEEIWDLVDLDTPIMILP